MSDRTTRTRGALAGLTAALLFGASAPVAKLLLPALHPLLLAGLLYLGAGLALLVVGLVRPRARAAREAPLSRADHGLLAAITVLGGIVAPVLMLIGLTRVSGVAGALLLNLEGPATVVLAVLIFREHLGAHGLGAVACVIAGGALLAWSPGELRVDVWGVLAIAGACLAWGVDNNLTQRLSLRDPVAIVRGKALGAAACTLTAAIVQGGAWPPVATVGAALVLGSVSYGVSILLDVYALRILGAAREAAFFATAPFMGAVLAVPLLGEGLGRAELGAAVLMAGGVLLLLRERHAHVHTHDPLEHDHVHVHDAHHTHDHDHDGPVIEPHAHPHRHAPITHDHPHLPDLHHRHRH